jgi:preprotein translocase subunit SecY
MLAWRIAFTVGALLICVVGTYIPLPGTDIDTWAQLVLRPLWDPWMD